MKENKKETIVEAESYEVVEVKETEPAKSKGQEVLEKVKKVGKKAAPIVGAFALGVLATILGTKLKGKKEPVSENYDDTCDYGVEAEEFDYPMEDPVEETVE